MEFLVRELAEIMEMLVGMNRTVTGQGLEEKGGETGDRVVGLEEQEKGEGMLAPHNSLTEENQNGKEKEGHISSEDRDTVMEIEGEQVTEGQETGKGKCIFYIAQYPVRWTAQSDLHFLPPLADLFIRTPTRLLREAF